MTAGRTPLSASAARSLDTPGAVARAAAPDVSRLRAALALSGVRPAVMRWGSSHPRLLAPLLELWPRVRPSVLPRAGRCPSAGAHSSLDRSAAAP